MPRPKKSDTKKAVVKLQVAAQQALEAIDANIVGDGAALAAREEQPPAQDAHAIRTMEGDVITIGVISAIKVQRVPDGIGNIRNDVKFLDATTGLWHCYTFSWTPATAQQHADDLSMLVFGSVLAAPPVEEATPPNRGTGYVDTSREAYLAMQQRTPEGGVYQGESPLSLIATPNLPMYTPPTPMPAAQENKYEPMVAAHGEEMMGGVPNGTSVPRRSFAEGASAPVEAVSMSNNGYVNPGDRQEATPLTAPDANPYQPVHAPGLVPGAPSQEYNYISHGPGFPMDAYGRPVMTADGSMQIFDASRIVAGGAAIPSGRTDPVAQHFEDTYEPRTKISLPGSPTR